MAMFKSRAFGLSTVLMATLALVPQARADDFYKGKLFTIVVGFSPAGGYDNYGRVLSRYIGGHIPGNPTVIVQNMPGAGSLTSVRYLNLTAPKDGTELLGLLRSGVNHDGPFTIRYPRDTAPDSPPALREIEPRHPEDLGERRAVVEEHVVNRLLALRVAPRRERHRDVAQRLAALAADEVPCGAAEGPAEEARGAKRQHPHDRSGEEQRAVDDASPKYSELRACQRRSP